MLRRNIIVRPHSVTFNRDEFLRKIDSIDSNSVHTVSFDFFDTLVFRNSISHHSGWREVSLGFYFNRILAEVLARVIGRLSGRPEVNLGDIYRFILPRWNPGVEIENETKNLRPNPFLRDIFNDLIIRGVRVVVISDTHFENSVISTWLDKLGFSNSTVYTSQEFFVTKSTGLFEVIHDLRSLPYEHWIHVGDNPRSDISAAEMLGIDALFYPKLLAQFQDIPLLSPRGQKRLSKFGAQEFAVSTHLRELVCSSRPPNLNQEDLLLWYLGFFIGAPVSRSISEKIHFDHLAKQFDIILYSSRDGYLPFISHSFSYPLDPTVYFKTSRAMSMRELFPRYVDQLIGNSEKVAIFDLGWRGSTLDSLKKEFPDVKWFGYFWILRNRKLNRQTVSQIAQQNKLSFWRSRDFLEVLFTDPSSGYGSLNSDLEPVQRSNQVNDKARLLMLEGSEFGVRTTTPCLAVTDATFLLSLITRFPSKKVLSLFDSEQHEIRGGESNYLVTNSWSRLFSKNRVMWPPSALLKRSYFGLDSIVFKLLVVLKELIQRTLNLSNRARNLVLDKLRTFKNLFS